MADAVAVLFPIDALSQKETSIHRLVERRAWPASMSAVEGAPVVV
jgi:hypothetical protein